MANPTEAKGPDVSTVVVTGGAKRIGKVIVQAFAKAGWKVVIHYNASETQARKLADEITGAGGEAELLNMDLAQVAPSKKIFDDFLEQQNVDCLINSAAIFDYDLPTDIDPDILETALNVNLKAPLTLSESCFASLKARHQHGCIINVLDNKVFALNPDFFSYTVSKCALHGATQMMAMTYAPVARVNAIAPGITLASGAQSQDDYQRVHDHNPLGRGCTPDQIAKTALFITKTASLNGQVITLDGGANLTGQARDLAFTDIG